LAAVEIGATSVVLALPVAFMNECGGPVGSVARYYRVPAEAIVLVHDDIDLPFGKLRFQFGRGTGGHNGVASVMRALGTGDVWRLKFGVGRPPGRMDPAEYVLRRFTSAERADTDFLVAEAAEVLRAFAVEGGEAARRRAGEAAGRLDFGRDEPT
jgi:PTH1 family peptidyl-tRNA hydrolase